MDNFFESDDPIEYTILNEGQLSAWEEIKLNGNWVIKGCIPNHCSITVNGHLKVTGNIENDVKVVVSRSAKVQGLGLYVTLQATSIHARAVGTHSKLYASDGGIDFEDGGNDIEIVANGPINFRTVGSYAVLTASEIKGKKAGAHSTFRAIRGGVDLVYGKENINVEADGSLVFNTIGSYARLTASQITGKDVGAHSTLRAVKSDVMISGRVGVDCSIQNGTAPSLQSFEKRAHKISKTSPLGYYNVGCGIHADPRSKSYIIPDALIESCREEYSALFEQLLNLGYRIQQETFNENGRDVSAHRVIPDGTKESTETLRKLITEYIQNNKQLGDAGGGR